MKFKFNECERRNFVDWNTELSDAFIEDMLGFEENNVENCFDRNDSYSCSISRYCLRILSYKSDNLRTMIEFYKSSIYKFVHWKQMIKHKTYY